MAKLAEFGRDAQPSDRQKKAVSFRAFLEAPCRLTIVHTIRRATLAKYRGDSKFSHAFKAKGIRTDERVLGSFEVVLPVTDQGHGGAAGSA